MIDYTTPPGKPTTTCQLHGLSTTNVKVIMCVTRYEGTPDECKLVFKVVYPKLLGSIHDEFGGVVKCKPLPVSK